MCLWRWRCGSWGMSCSKCYHYNICTPFTPDPSLGAAESRPKSN
jgi:hypothetical protein